VVVVRKTPTIFGMLMVSTPPPIDGGDVHHWQLSFGPIVVVLDPEVLGSPPFESPTWELFVGSRSLGRNLRKAAATRMAEQYLRGVHAAIDGAIKDATVPATEDAHELEACAELIRSLDETGPTESNRKRVKLLADWQRVRKAGT
jgi:hypothetical protein